MVGNSLEPGGQEAKKSFGSIIRLTIPSLMNLYTIHQLYCNVCGSWRALEE
ncbi:MAG: hypothetical protein OK457_08545 [Thaumarchaeota archaeon]|nr:hypothetical protein [Nitrososphaerota archaeon]